MTRYELRPVGVWDRDRQALVTRGSAGWREYFAFRAAGGEPDPAPAVAGVPIEERRARRVVDLRERVAMREAAPFQIAGAAVVVTPDERAAIIGAVAVAAAGGAEQTIAVALADGTGEIALTSMQARTLAERIVRRALRLAAKRREIAAVIATSDDPEAVSPDPGED